MPDIKALYSDYVKTLDTYIMFKIKQKTVALTPELLKKDRKPIMLSIGSPTTRPPEYVIDALKKALDEDKNHTYSTTKGEKYFLEAAAQRMKNRFGVDISVDNGEVTSLVGSKEGLCAMFRALINPSLNPKEQDIIMIPDPGYASYKEQIRTAGGNAYPIPLKPENNYMPDPEEVLAQLEKDGFDPKKVKAFVVNYPNNPLGVCATREYLQKVVDFCYKRNILLMSDVAYVDMYFEGEEAPASIFEFPKAKEIAIEFHSLSKPYALTGWRIGWACGNKDAVGILAKVKSTIDTGVFKAIQKAASEILVSPIGDEYIKEVNKSYEERQQIMVNGLKELGWDFSKIDVPRATFYLWVPIPSRYKTATDFANALLETSGIVVVPGTGFGTYGEGYIRIAVTATADDIKLAIKRMKEDGFYFEK